ncbi:MAG: YbbR-like domain-containing protein [Candidatus Ozemobacteraceae bacterium]|jgi:YbbR domain-containing protein
MTDRIWLKLFSVLLAIFAWMYVNLVDPPQIRRNIELPVEYINTSPNIRITPSKAMTVVRFEGNRRDFMYAKSSNRYAQLRIDLKNLKPGSFRLPVELSNVFPGLSPISLSPELLLLDAEEVVSKKIKVLVEILGQPAEGYLADPPIVEPSEITILGPQEIVESITECYAEINLDRVRNSISQTPEVLFKTTDSIDKSRIISEPAKVRVDVAVKQGYPTKSVKISRPSFRGKLPDGKRLDAYSVVPPEVLISGPNRIIAPINEISFRPINLSQLQESSNIPVSIELPNDKVTLPGSDTVYLEVKLTDIPITRTYDALPLEIISPANKTVYASVSSYTLEIEGMTQDLDKIVTSNLKIVVTIPDTNEKELSIKLLEPLNLPENLKITDIRPGTITVSLQSL